MVPATGRRRVLGALAAGVLAGCIGAESSGPRGDPADGPEPERFEEASGAAERDDVDDDSIPNPENGPPTADSPYVVSQGIDAVTEHAIETDAWIPTIDDPVFTDAAGIEDATFDLEPGDIVFGVERDGEPKAYPQRILVYHEIVNDELAGDPVSITYCPLTGTAQGFERREGFKVSGWLFNSNLVMVDTGTETWWPQIYATGVDEPFRSESLDEFRLVWTTWERWRDVHPETLVLTAETGYERRYHDDPYGGYNPRMGYYDFGGPMYEILAEPDDDSPLEDKDVVIGCRTENGAAAFAKEALLDRGLLRTEIDGVEHVAVADPRLATGYVYANPDGRSVERGDTGTYRVDDESASAAELPLKRRLAFDAMWFAWYAHYPDTALSY